MPAKAVRGARIKLGVVHNHAICVQQENTWMRSGIPMHPVKAAPLVIFLLGQEMNSAQHVQQANHKHQKACLPVMIVIQALAAAKQGISTAMYVLQGRTAWVDTQRVYNVLLEHTSLILTNPSAQIASLENFSQTRVNYHAPTVTLASTSKLQANSSATTALLESTRAAQGCQHAVCARRGNTRQARGRQPAWLAAA